MHPIRTPIPAVAIISLFHQATAAPAYNSLPVLNLDATPSYNSFVTASASLSHPGPSNAVSPLIQAVAGGNVPNTAPPPHISLESALGLQLINFLENLESAFFTEGHNNITLGVYPDASRLPPILADVVGKIATQEDVHVATAVNPLEHFGFEVIQPCQYSFPVTTGLQFAALADVVTNVGIGALAGLAQVFAEYGDSGLVSVVTAINALEGRHSAFLRLIANELPNPAPADTLLTPEYAYNLAQGVILPDSCPTYLPFPIFPALGTSQAPIQFAPVRPAANLTFTFPINITNTSTYSPIDDNSNNHGLYIGWINQHNDPTYTPLIVTGPGIGTAIVPLALAGQAYAVLTRIYDGDICQLTRNTLAGPVPVPISQAVAE